jgi:hypothetical protein
MQLVALLRTIVVDMSCSFAAPRFGHDY